jgi:hypothetical protein
LACAAAFARRADRAVNSPLEPALASRVWYLRGLVAFAANDVGTAEQVLASPFEHVLARPFQPGFGRVALIRRTAGEYETGRGLVLDRVFGEFWADDTHQGIIWGSIGPRAVLTGAGRRVVPSTAGTGRLSPECSPRPGRYGQSFDNHP